MAKKKKTANPEVAPSAPAPAELSFEEALEAAGQPAAEAREALAEWTGVADGPETATPPAEAPAELKEEKESPARETGSAAEAPAKRVRKTEQPAAEAPKPVNRIEKEGADFRLIVATEPRGSYAFYATAAKAFKAEVGRRPVIGEFPNGDPKPEAAPKVVNGCRIQAAEGGGYNVYLDGNFYGWKKDLGEAEAYLARIKTDAAAKLAAKVAPEAAKTPGTPAVPAEDPAPTEKSPKPAKTESKRGKKAADPGPAISPELAAHCAKTVLEAGVEAEAGRIRESLITLKALSAGYGPDAIAKFLADLPEGFIRSEAERRGLLKPASKPTNGNRGPANREAHVELTKKAWVRARELAAEKGGKPQDHMKEAWSGLVRD